MGAYKRLLCGVVLALSALPQAAWSGPPAPRWYSQAQVAEGAALFARHCVGCHLEDARGAAEWKRMGGNGKLRPPPLDGTAHAWHHPLAVLREVIAQGGDPAMSDMPAWGGVLDARQIDALIAWFQSLWPDEVYRTWWREVQPHGARAGPLRRRSRRAPAPGGRAPRRRAFRRRGCPPARAPSAGP